jgi:hypothetical protein
VLAVVIFVKCAKYITADAAKAVDCDTNSHESAPLVDNFMLLCSFSNVVNITIKIGLLNF